MNTLFHRSRYISAADCYSRALLNATATFLCLSANICEKGRLRIWQRIRYTLLQYVKPMYSRSPSAPTSVKNRGDLLTVYLKYKKKKKKESLIKHCTKI